jgi:hypothetical protein
MIYCYWLAQEIIEQNCTTLDVLFQPLTGFLIQHERDHRLMTTPVYASRIAIKYALPAFRCEKSQFAGHLLIMLLLHWDYK